jgi:hypothetical protein
MDPALALRGGTLLGRGRDRPPGRRRARDEAAQEGVERVVSLT